MRSMLLLAATILALVSAAPAARSTDTHVLQRVLDQWAVAWSSSEVEKLLPLFTDNVDSEDVTLALANHGSKALQDFAAATFGSFADIKFELKSRLVAADGERGAMEWVWRGRQTKDLPGLPATNNFSPVTLNVRVTPTVTTDSGVHLEFDSKYKELRLLSLSSGYNWNLSPAVPEKARPWRV